MFETGKMREVRGRLKKEQRKDRREGTSIAFSWNFLNRSEGKRGYFADISRGVAFSLLRCAAELRTFGVAMGSRLAAGARHHGVGKRFREIVESSR